MVISFVGYVIIGVGIVLMVEDVVCVVDVGGWMIVLFNMNFDVICEICKCGLESYFGVFIVIECFVVIVVGVMGLKIFFVDQVSFGYLKVLCVVLLFDMLVYVVGGVGLGNFVDWFVVGVQGFGIGLLFYKLGDSVDIVVICVCEMVVVLI